jgi:hypothetical protein
MPVTLRERLARELQPDGTLLPPWRRYPEIPAGLIGWRMGHGEDYLDLWGDWARRLTRNQLLDYFRRFAPLPVEWAFWVACQLDDDVDLDAPEPHIARLAESGLVDLAAWRAHWSSDAP